MSKEKRPIDSRLYDPGLADENFVQGNLLTIPVPLKTFLTEQGMDWRFLNAKEYRANGSIHNSQWQPLKVPADLDLGLTAVTAERHLQRGDLILGIRPKTISAKHKEALRKKNELYSNFGKNEAKRLKEYVKSRGMSVKISEGYDEDEGGFKGGED